MPKGLTRRRVGAALALGAAIAVVLIVVLNNSSASAGSSNNNSALSNSPGVTTVQRRDLVQTDTESGTLSYANPETVYNDLSGTITWLPKVGQLIRPGQTLFKIDNVPVMLMNGTTPAFRDLSAADTPGPDILELNRNLIALGFNPDGIVADDTWQAATTAGVDVLQAYLGQTETGILALGQVVFLPGPQLVSTLSETLGADPSGGTSAAALSAATTPAASTEFVDLRSGPTTTPATTTTPAIRRHQPGGQPPGHGQPRTCQPPKAPSRHRQKCSGVTGMQALIALLRAEIAELRSQKSLGSNGSPSGGSPNGGHSNPSGGHSNPNNAGGGGGGGGGGGSGGGGAGGGAGTAVLQTTSTQLVVTVDLDASKQSEAKVGEKVTVEMPAGNAVDGTISAVSSVATTSSGSGNGSGSGGGGGNGSGSGSSSSIPVTITLKHTPKGRGLDQAAVSVNFAEAQAKNVLSVPVTALLAVPGGGYAVQEAASPHRLIRVTTGLFAAGYVQISGPGITDGLQVTNSEG